MIQVVAAADGGAEIILDLHLHLHRKTLENRKPYTKIILYSNKEAL